MVVRAGPPPPRLVLRSRIVLFADGLSARVARELAVSRHTVNLWRAPYEKDGVRRARSRQIYPRPQAVRLEALNVVRDLTCIQ
jgi:transposase